MGAAVLVLHGGRCDSDADPKPPPPPKDNDCARECAGRNEEDCPDVAVGEEEKGKVVDMGDVSAIVGDVEEGGVERKGLGEGLFGIMFETTEEDEEKEEAAVTAADENSDNEDLIKRGVG